MANDPENAPAGDEAELGSLESRIAAARKTEDLRISQEHHQARMVRGKAIQIASTMVGYPLGGIIVGFALDKFFGTVPWITITLMFLAFIGACINVIRLGKGSDNGRAI